MGAVVPSAYLDGAVLASGTQAGAWGVGGGVAAGGALGASSPGPRFHLKALVLWKRQALGRLCSASTFLLLHKREAFFSGLYLHFPNQKTS